MFSKTLVGSLCLLAPMAVFAQVDQEQTVDEVVVTGVRGSSSARHLPNTVTVVGDDALAARQNTNVLPSLADEVPGLFVSQRGMMGYGVSGGAAGGITLRGLSSGNGQVLVLIDGHPQYQGVFGHSIADSYETMMAERVEVLRGPASVLYGSNAMGGVVNIVTRGMKHDGLQTNARVGAGSYGTFQAEVNQGIKSGKVAATIAANYGRSDNHRPRMGFEQYGAYTKVNCTLTDNWSAFVDLDITHFNASNPGSESAPLLEADQWITRGVATLGVENTHDRTRGRVAFYDNFGRHKINDGYAPDAKPQTELFRSKDALSGISVYQIVSLWDGAEFTVGADVQHIYGRAYYTSRATGEIVTTGRRGMQSTHQHCNELAGYADLRQDLGEMFTLDAGLRIDHHSVAGTEVVPQGGVVFRPLQSAQLKLMVSKGFRNPSVKEMFLYGTANHDSLCAERAMNYEAAWHQSVGNARRFSYGVNFYIFKGDNMIQTVGGKNINTGEFENRGLELDASFRVTDFLSLRTNHSFIHQDSPIVGTPDYKGFIGANLRVSRFGLCAGVQHVSDLYKAVGKEEITEDFTLLNVSADFHVTNSLSVWAKGENLLAQKYEINAGYPMPKATVMAGLKFSIGKSL